MDMDIHEASGATRMMLRPPTSTVHRKLTASSRKKSSRLSKKVLGNADFARLQIRTQFRTEPRSARNNRNEEISSVILSGVEGANYFAKLIL